MDDVRRILTDFMEVRAACQSLSNKSILVGIVGTNDSEVMKIAAIHEYGLGKMPERSFIRASFDADEDKLTDIVEGQVTKVLANQTSADNAANAIGAQAAQLVQNFIDENRVKPRSDFSRKTQRTTLFETGTHIRDRIAYKVEG